MQLGFHSMPTLLYFRFVSDPAYGAFPPAVQIFVLQFKFRVLVTDFYFAKDRDWHVIVCGQFWKLSGTAPCVCINVGIYIYIYICRKTFVGLLLVLGLCSLFA